MKFINILFLFLFFCINSYAVKGLENIFTADIYDQSELPVSATNTEKIVLFKIKKQKLLDEKIVNPTTIEIKALEKLLEEMTQKRNVAAYFLYPTSSLLAALPYILIAENFNHFAPRRGALASNDFLHYMRSIITQPDLLNRFYRDCIIYCETRIAALKSEVLSSQTMAQAMLEQIAPIDDIKDQLSLKSNYVLAVGHLSMSGKIFDLECLYVSKKSKIPVNWQNKIESTFMCYYNQEVFHDEKFLESMITFPTEIKVLSVAFDYPYFNDTYFNALEKITTNLKNQIGLSEAIQDDCEQILTSIAQCAQVTLDPNNEDPTRSFSYCQLALINNVEFEGLSKLIANVLGLPYYIVDAKKEVLNHEFLFGSYKCKKGLFLEGLQAGNYLNSILIIKNIDHWVKDITTLPWVLKLFDTNAKTFDSNYLGFKVDWSKLNIICSGETSIDQLDNAFESRVTPYSF